MCLVNPPFKGTADAESINDNLKAVTNTKKTEMLFGVLFFRMQVHKAIHKELVENHQLRAVIFMPSGVFKPCAGVSIAVLDKVSDLITKHRQQLDKLDEMIMSRFVKMFGDLEPNAMKWSIIEIGQ